MFLLALFGKGERANLTKAERNALATMTKRLLAAYSRPHHDEWCATMTRKAFEKIAAGLADSASYRVHAPAVDVGYGFAEADVRGWEQATSRPEGATRACLLVVARETEAVDRAPDLPAKSAA